MYSNRPPPPYPVKLTIAVFGKKGHLKNTIGNMILSCKNAFVTMSNGLVVGENSSFTVLNTPDFFDEECLHPDQQIIDFMALSLPGPNLFILAIDSENTQEENIVSQISKLQDTFGEKIRAHLVVMLPDIESFNSLDHLKEVFNSRLAVANENLAIECKKWCLNQEPFSYDYKNYSEDVVTRRKTALQKRSFRCSPVHQNERPVNSTGGVPDNMFNIVLLGLTGTGKSASANTILAAGDPQLDPAQLFLSMPSSVPVTTKCEVKMMQKPFGMHVRVVDTPDFFHDQLANVQAHIEECKKYCQPGQCVLLLVLQLGRFTDEEWGILEQLEKILGWNIRESTIVVLTHAEDLKGRVEKYISTQDQLKNIVLMCGGRYQLFNNNSGDTKQVMELIKKIPNYKNIFPKFTKKTAHECMMC